MSEPTDTNDQPDVHVIPFHQAKQDLETGVPPASVQGPWPPSTEIGPRSEPPQDTETEPPDGGDQTEEWSDAKADQDDSATTVATASANQVVGKRISLVGRLGSMNRREAINVLQSFRAAVVELPRQSSTSSGTDRDWSAIADWIVIGAEQPPLAQSELLPQDLIDAAARGDLEILHETELWQRLGLVDVEQESRRYYTPVMLADLLKVSVRVIRRWHRRGLITPIMTLHKLPYFDYAEVATAKRLAGWIAAGASPAAIERRLVDLVQVLPGIRRPLDQLSILVEGKHILLRQGDGLVEPGGQMRFDFDALDADPLANDHGDANQTVAFELPDQPPMLRAIGKAEEDPILVAAYQAEDDDDLETAVELYHTILARDGCRADVCFQIGELLYRMNFLVAARERYYIAIEIDPEFVEARASLGAVLAELGQFELAVAALQGALSMYDDYADVHYTLAKTLDKIGREPDALPHWQKIIELAPESPWANEARERLGLPD